MSASQQSRDVGQILGTFVNRAQHRSVDWGKQILRQRNAPVPRIHLLGFEFNFLDAPGAAQADLPNVRFDGMSRETPFSKPAEGDRGMRG